MTLEVHRRDRSTTTFFRELCRKQVGASGKFGVNDNGHRCFSAGTAIACGHCLDLANAIWPDGLSLSVFCAYVTPARFGSERFCEAVLRRSPSPSRSRPFALGLRSLLTNRGSQGTVTARKLAAVLVFFKKQRKWWQYFGSD